MMELLMQPERVMNSSGGIRKNIITIVIAAVVGLLTISAVPINVRNYSRATTIVAIRSYHYIDNVSTKLISYPRCPEYGNLNSFLCEIGGSRLVSLIDNHLSARPNIPTRLFLLAHFKTIPLSDESEPDHCLLS